MTERSYSPSSVTALSLRQAKGSIRFGRHAAHEKQADMDGDTYGIDNEEKVAVRSGGQEEAVQEDESRSGF